jgi:hypothetical protein
MVSSLPHRSLDLDAWHRQGWGSLYDALAAGHWVLGALEQVLTAYPLSGGIPIYALDASVWARCDAETGPEGWGTPSAAKPHWGQVTV